MADAILDVRGLTRRFGALTAVDALSFAVAKGCVTGFIGPNRSVSRPRCAITSIGRQPSKNVARSKSCTVADSACVNAS